MKMINSDIEPAMEKPLTILNTLNTSNDQYQKYKDFKWQDPNTFKNGPIGDESRSCRDILCLFIFFVFIGGCIVVGVLGFKDGNPSLLLYPYDEDGNQCGINELKDYKYLYFYESISNIINFNVSGIANSICITSCPNKQLSEVETEIIIDCYFTIKNTNCKIMKSNYYLSKEIFNRFCIPIDSDMNSNIINDVISSANQLFNMVFVNTDRLILWMGDLYNTWLALFASLGWSFLIALSFLVLVRFCSGFMIYSTIVLVLGGLISLGVFCHLNANEDSEINDSIYYKTMLAIAISCYIISGLWLLYIILMCNRIRLAVSLMSVAAKYIGQNFCIVFVPLIFLLLSGVYYTYWILCSLYLYSTGEINTSNNIIANIEWSSKARYAWWFHLFSLIYINELIRSVSEFVYASSACIWYFTHEKKIKESLIKKSFKRLFKYHFGSCAFGALIISIIKFIMFFMNFIRKRIDNTIRKNKHIGRCFKCCVFCCQCCLNCVARTMEFINRHAYIQIALKGDSFCVSAWEGFGLIVRNIGRFSALHLLGGLFNLFGIVFISIVSGLIGFLLITEVDYFNSNLNSPVIPTFVMTMIGLVIGMMTMTVFGTSADALLHSFLLDEEINKGQPKSFPELQKFMAKER